MKKTLLLIAVASFMCLTGGCASTSEGTNTYDVAGAYSKAVEARDAAVEAKKNASSTTSSSTTKDSVKQAVKDATAEKKQQVNDEIDAWKSAFK
ncbi:hypothetical protein Dip518_001505 [Parelusimicrobium proximum]|uniref:hypothetical protein n=1 Tax=Parelusimicrobium proximum TaxID=3228953 RepID=UPI003D16D777